METTAASVSDPHAAARQLVDDLIEVLEIKHAPGARPVNPLLVLAVGDRPL